MNELKYKSQFRRFVLEGVRQYMTDRNLPVDMSVTGYPALGTEDSLVYFENHFPRFQAMIELCQQHSIRPYSPCELGSFYPYTTLYFGGEIDLFDITPKVYPAVVEYDVYDVHLRGIDLNVDQPPERDYDLVILSEVMEHLPCDLFGLCSRVTKIIRPDGHLIVTYPTQHNIHPYGYEETIGVSGREYGDHLREFTDDTVGLFFTNLTTVARIEMSYPAYGRTAIVLYKNTGSDHVAI